MEKYQQRLIKEYKDLKEKHSKLGWMLAKWDAFNEKGFNSNMGFFGPKIEDFVGFDPKAPYSLYKRQYQAMTEYLEILRIRLVLEGLANEDLD